MSNQQASLQQKVNPNLDSLGFIFSMKFNYQISFVAARREAYNGKQYLEIASNDLSKCIGVFSFAVKKVDLHSFVSGYVDKGYCLTLNLNYTSFSNGTNGMEIARCWWSESSGWTILWQNTNLISQYDWAGREISACEEKDYVGEWRQ